MALEPHASAKDSVVASVDTGDRNPNLDLRPLAESVYRNTGILVLFRKLLSTQG